jgi:hypothetical protein
LIKKKIGGIIHGIVKHTKKCKRREDKWREKFLKSISFECILIIIVVPVSSKTNGAAFDQRENENAAALFLFGLLLRKIKVSGDEKNFTALSIASGEKRTCKL